MKSVLFGPFGFAPGCGNHLHLLYNPQWIAAQHRSHLRLLRFRNRVCDFVPQVLFCFSDALPEFLNRIDETIVFHRLTDEQLREIVAINLAEVSKRLREKDIELVLTDEAKDFIVKRGTDEEYGARPLRRAVQQLVEDPLSEQLLMGAFEPGSRVVVQVSELTGDLMFNTELPVAESISS